VSGTPPSVTPDDIRFQPRTLRAGRPAEVGLLGEHVDRVRVELAAYLRPTADHPNHPAFPGAVVLAAKDGVVVLRKAVGMAVRYSSVGPAPGRVGVELPADQRITATTRTMFDLASVSKLFTTIVLMQLVEAGRVNLDTTVASYLPEFAAGDKETVTVRHLLTHTSGLPPFRPLYSEFPTPAARFAGALTTPVMAGSSPGNQYAYSDLGLIALGVLVERKTGRTLDDAVRTVITGPLSMVDTGYRPDVARRPRIAATEYQPHVNRGMVWGEVHDENAWSLGGVAGHAGLFSTVDDLAVFCQMLLNGGEYRGRRTLRADTIRTMLVNYNAHLESTFPDSDRGLGFELNKHSYMGGLSSPVTFGHTGFTGTSIVIDPLAHTFLILLSNRVHPDRNWGTNTVTRRALASALADAEPVRPPLGGWSPTAGHRRTPDSLRWRDRSSPVRRSRCCG
jgi:CubicO group peptidase (beta-lactamase class C family)